MNLMSLSLSPGDVACGSVGFLGHVTGPRYNPTDRPTKLVGADELKKNDEHFHSFGVEYLLHTYRYPSADFVAQAS
jgi:hypothetical protein